MINISIIVCHINIICCTSENSVYMYGAQCCLTTFQYVQHTILPLRLSDVCVLLCCILLIVWVLVFFRVYRPLHVDILELLIGHSHGYSNPVQHKKDAEALWASGKKFVSHETSESLVSPAEHLAQYVPI
jgi:hypothetical protein